MKNTSRDDHIIFEGVVIESIHDKFTVLIDGTETKIIATLSGKMRLNKIRILNGDKVTVNVSKYDTTKGIIKERK